MSRVVGESSELEQWIVFTACSGCLAVTRSIAINDTHATAPTIHASGADVARLRETLRRAGDNDTIRREVGRLMTDRRRQWLASVPELFPEILPGLGKAHRLRTNLELNTPDESRPAFLGTPIPWTTKGRGPVSTKIRESAITGGSDPGGVLPEGSIYRWRAVMLVGTRVTVTGVRGQTLRVEVPAWAAPTLGTPRVLVPWGSTSREEEI